MTASYNDSVFINCPFDPEYQEIFRALVFTVHDCGFLARCALEVDDSGEVRIAKINRIIREQLVQWHPRGTGGVRRQRAVAGYMSIVAGEPDV